MKYMGSKRSMLQNGLGALIESELPMAERFVDLFSGSAAVSWFAATKFDIEVHAFDLQQYSAVIAKAVIGRTEPLSADEIWGKWEAESRALVRRLKIPEVRPLTKPLISDLRDWCDDRSGQWEITRAYGGHYFSPMQAVWIDALRKTLPRTGVRRDVALASLIEAASKCAAAPGHTAQPFQPTKTAKKFLQEAWGRDICLKVKSSLESISKLYARKKGRAVVQDANMAATFLREGDLVFIDPPYSGVHYSRFYHVLETISRGSCGKVSGVGRYPHPNERPRSDYSISTKSAIALDKLFASLAERGVRAIFTFPAHVCSNGLSGEIACEVAAKYFRVTKKEVKSRFSTLGGNGTGKSGSRARAARQNANELILLLDSR